MFSLRRHKTSQAFTLVEVSLVLFVLAVLVSITITGTKLVERAKANKIIKEISEYRSAINTFYKTYGALPGDFAEAQYRLAKSGETTTAIETIKGYDTELKKQIPINGNQDGSVSAEIDGTNFYSEAFGVWSALGQSGLIADKYSSFCYEDVLDINKCGKVGYNLPKVAASSNNAGYVFYRPTTAQEETNDDKLMGVLLRENNVSLPIVDNTNNEMRKHILAIMDVSQKQTFDGEELSGVRGGAGAISSNIMRIIDDKIDDGRPLSGFVYGLNGVGKNGYCSNSASNKQLTIYTNTAKTTTQPATREKVVYNNKNDQFCIGVIVIDEF